jgi:uncharacterized protein with HEPN domain
MVGFRDKLIHFYFDIRYDIVWETIKSRLSKLKEKIKKVFENPGKEK